MLLTEYHVPKISAANNPAPADMMRAYAALGLNYPNPQQQQNIRMQQMTNQSE